MHERPRIVGERETPAEILSAALLGAQSKHQL